MPADVPADVPADAVTPPVFAFFVPLARHATKAPLRLPPPAASPIVDGVFSLPLGPGWGIDVDEEALLRHPPLNDAKSGIWSAAPTAPAPAKRART